MRTPTEHVAHDGTVTFKVRFRRDGKQSSLTFYGATGHFEAVKFCKLLDTVGADEAVNYLAREAEAPTPTEFTLDEWAGRYIQSLTGITDGTREQYTRMYGWAWHQALGHLPLRLVDRERIAAQFNTITGTRADTTVENARGLLSAMLQVAVFDGYLPANPCKGIRSPRRTDHETVEHRFLSPIEFDSLVAAMPKHYRPLLMLLVGSGMRWGEADALTVADLDLSIPSVRINKAVKWRGYQTTPVVGPTKTPKSRRTVTLPSQVAEVLHPLVDGRAGTDRVFLAERGGALRHHTVFRAWVKACDQAGLVPRPRIHDLRHTHVAWLVASNKPLPVIQARLGHESITTTIDTYGHLLPSLDAAAVDDFPRIA
jgi:integrase